MKNKITIDDLANTVTYRSDFVRRDEFEDLMARVKNVEMKLGIVSGK